MCQGPVSANKMRLLPLLLSQVSRRKGMLLPSNACGNPLAPRLWAPHCCTYNTRSTGAVEPEELFGEGAAARAEVLHDELRAIGFEDLEALRGSAAFRGSAALRTYNSFVWPKSAGALSNAEKPGRAATTASQIAFLVREHRAAHADWLRNADRAQSESLADGHFPLYLVLDNVRSAANVGNILRAAEAARAARVLHCGITPMPPEPRLLKTAVGAAELVRHEHCASTLKAVRSLQARGVQVWACETTQGSVAHSEVQLPQPLGLVLGNEVIGIDTEVLAACDGVLQVPVYGVKNSLNVATAATVVMWEALRQWELQPDGLRRSREWSAPIC